MDVQSLISKNPQAYKFWNRTEVLDGLSKTSSNRIRDKEEKLPVACTTTF